MKFRILSLFFMALLLSCLTAIPTFAMDNKVVEVSNKNIMHTQRNVYTLTAEEKALIRKLVDEDLARLNAENITTFRKNKDQDYSIAELFRKNRKTAEEIYDKYIYYLGTRHFAFAEGYRATIFIDLVKTGGAWDIKSNPLKARGAYLWRKIYRTGEYIGNYHYGYMGRIIGYNTTQLKIAGGIYQFYGGNFKWSWISSFFDDPEDAKAIEHGASEYKIRF